MRVPYFGRLSFLYAKNTSRHRPARVCNPGTRECPELGKEVYIFECLECEKYAIWHEKDEFRMCYYEFKELESRGRYDGTWDDHPENFDPETFERIREEKRRNEEINRELDLERAELEKRAEELEKKFPPSYFSKYDGSGADGGEDDHKDEDGDDLVEEDYEEPDQPDEGEEEDYF